MSEDIESHDKHDPHRSQLNEEARVIYFYIILTLVEGVIALVFLLSIPSDPKNVRLFGFSPLRLGLAGVIVSIIAVLFAVTVWAWRNKNRFEKVSEKFSNFTRHRLRFWSTIAITTAGFILCIYLFFLLYVGTDRYILSYLIRLSPLIFWFGCWCLQTSAVLLIFRYGTVYLESRKVALKRFDIGILFFVSFLLIWILIAWSRIGLDPYDQSWLGRGWGSPGVPLLFQQVLLAWGIGMSLVLAGLLVILGWGNARLVHFLVAPPSLNRADFLIGLSIWILASYLWISEPLKESWFNPPPRPPTFEYHPFSDSALYDETAQNLLIGEGFKWGSNRIARRPLYALFLASLHGIAGQDYERVVALQVLVLAVFPVLLYLLTTRIHYRASGIIVATLIILRERTAIDLSNVITISHAKLLMTDLPVTVGVILFALLVFVWLKNPALHWIYPLIIGGCLGLLMLIRPQVILLASIPIILSLFSLRRLSRWLGTCFLLLVGIALAVFPWLWRNWQITGSLVFDDSSQRSMLVRHLTDNPEAVEDERQPGETDTDYSQRLNQLILQSVVDQPGYVARSVLLNFIRNEIFTILILPNSLQWESPTEYVKRLPYWFRWDGAMEKRAGVYLGLDLFLVAVGIGAAWRRHRNLGLVPLYVNAVYSLSTALVRYSGGRFILPGDWAGILYFGIGLSEITLFILSTYSGVNLDSMYTPEDILTIRAGAPSRRGTRRMSPPLMVLVGIMVLIFLTGSALPLTEKLIPPRFSGQSEEETLAFIMESDMLKRAPSGIENILKTASSDERVILLRGRVLYPRYYAAGEGDIPSRPHFEARSCDRLEFYLIGPQNAHVVMPLESSPPSFPLAPDVIVLGYQGEDYVDAATIFFLNPKLPALVRSEIPPLSCPTQ